MVKIVCISDTHLKLNKVPATEGDILIHAGDHTFDGSLRQMTDAIKQLAKYGKNFKHIITICGNHDFLGEVDPLLMNQLCRDKGIHYLSDSSIELEGLKFYGSAYTPEFCNWAFQLYTKEEAINKWSQIPEDVNVLITHGPRKNIRDKCPDQVVCGKPTIGESVGDIALGERIDQLKSLELHVFGHIHNSYGMTCQYGITYCNAAICDERYIPINAPIIVDL